MTNKLPPKPDFMTQEAWDALMATRSTESIRANSRMHADTIRNDGWGDQDSTQGGPTCLLTTVGRKSGQPRTSPVNYMLDGDNIIVVGSIAGLDRHPLWALNLDANNEAEIEMREGNRQVTARKVTGAERLELWPRLTEFFPLWGHFQQYCDREFKVFIMTPKK